jgi:hypothetical protein
MPLQRDDDYFYYHGNASIRLMEDDGKEDSDRDSNEDAVDHVGALIGFMISHASLEEPKQDVLRSSTDSDVTLDDGVRNELNGIDMMHQHDNIDDVMGLKIAELEYELHAKANEAVELNEKIQHLQELLLKERIEARQTDLELQLKVCDLKRSMKEMRTKIAELERENLDLWERSKGVRVFGGRRRSTFSDAYTPTSTPNDKSDIKSDNADMYVHFPCSRRNSTGVNQSRRRRSLLASSFTSRHEMESTPSVVPTRPSIATMIRHSFNVNSNIKKVPPNITNNNWSSRSPSPVVLDSSENSDDTDAHESQTSWATANEINYQTKLFNDMKNGNRYTSFKDDPTLIDTFQPARVDPRTPRHTELTRTASEQTVTRRRRPSMTNNRRPSFSLIGPMKSLSSPNLFSELLTKNTNVVEDIHLRVSLPNNEVSSSPPSNPKQRRRSFDLGGLLCQRVDDTNDSMPFTMQATRTFERVPLSSRTSKPKPSEPFRRRRSFDIGEILNIKALSSSQQDQDDCFDADSVMWSIGDASETTEEDEKCCSPEDWDR